MLFRSRWWTRFEFSEQRLQMGEPCSLARSIGVRRAMAEHIDVEGAARQRASRVDHPEGLRHACRADRDRAEAAGIKSEEHTPELQSLIRISNAVFRLQKKNKHNN